MAICRDLELVKARGKQRTDATRVLAAIRVMNCLEQVAETMRAALNELAMEAPVWLQSVAPHEWYQRYGRRIEDDRLPQRDAGREAYGQTVGGDGFHLLDLIAQLDAPADLDKLAKIKALRWVWERHYERAGEKVRFKSKKELANAPPGAESPYDTEARYRSRYGTNWTGYIVHLTETCEEDDIHLITHVETTEATVHESQRTENIHQALAEKGLPPGEHLTDSAYIDAELLINSRHEHQIDLFGPARYSGKFLTRKYATERFHK